MVARWIGVYVLVELAAVVALAWTIGLGWTLLVLLGTFVVGVALAGSQVKRQLLRLQQAPANPQAAIADSALVALGTVLVLVPGLVTTAAGLLMLLPQTRAAARPLAGFLATRGITRRIGVVNFAGGGTYAGRGDYIDGEVIEEQVYGEIHDANIVRRRDSY